MSKLTQETVQGHFHYDNKTGKFSRRFYFSIKHDDDAEKDKTKLKNGHVYLFVEGEYYSIRRLIWLYMTGKWPKNRVRTINGDPTDLRWVNLTLNAKLATRGPQRPGVRNKSGCAGVHYNKTIKRWVAVITRHGVKHHLISTQDKQLAIAHRKIAEIM